MSSLPPEGVRFALGRPCGTTLARAHNVGLTLLELLVVVAIMAFATAGVGLALRDSSQTQLEREAQRLSALLESARAQSRMTASPVRWIGTATGFRFEGTADSALPTQWLGDDVVVAPSASLALGPEPIIGPQRLRLTARSHPERSLTLATDGVGPFAVVADTAGP
jgi:general secretion pathway protein H